MHPSHHLLRSALVALIVASPMLCAPGGTALSPREQKVMDFVLAQRSQLRLGQENTFAQAHSSQDRMGNAFTALDQQYKGVKVWGAQVVTTMDKAGKVSIVADNTQKNLAVASMTPSFDQTKALEIITKDLKPLGPFVVAPKVELVLYTSTSQQLRPGNLFEVFNPKGVSVTHMAYHISTRLESDLEIRHTDYLLDANTGEIIRRWSTLQTDGVDATAHTQYAGDQTIRVNRIHDNASPTPNVLGYELRRMEGVRLPDLPGPTPQYMPLNPHPTFGTLGNYTLNMGNHYFYGIPDFDFGNTFYHAFTNNTADLVWGDGTAYAGHGPVASASANGETAGVDAHYDSNATMEYYLYNFGWDSFDGKGGSAISRVHLNNNFANAYWDGDMINVGDGGSYPAYGINWAPLASMSIISHEWSHGVTQYRGGLNYYGESGGLNEATSDIHGKMADFFARRPSPIPHNPGNPFVIYDATTHPDVAHIPEAADIGTNAPDWNIGTEIDKNTPKVPLRYMDHPSLDGMSADFWSPYIGQSDVHYNSGPMNRAFYFMAQGISATPTAVNYSPYFPYDQAGIGNDKAARIWFYAKGFASSYATYKGYQSAADRAASYLGYSWYAGDADGGWANTQALRAKVRNAFAAVNATFPASVTDSSVTGAVSRQMIIGYSGYIDSNNYGNLNAYKVYAQPGAKVHFKGYSYDATTGGFGQADAKWSVKEGAAGGSIDTFGVWQAPTQQGFYHILGKDPLNANNWHFATVRVWNPNVDGSATTDPYDNGLDGWDISAFITALGGKSSGTVTTATQALDLNGDGVINQYDLLMFEHAWTPDPNVVDPLPISN